MSLLQVANHYLQLNLQSKHMRGGRRGIKEEGRKRGRRHGEREREREGEDGGGGEKRGYLVWACDDILM
jgi:hypothetical protein